MRHNIELFLNPNSRNELLKIKGNKIKRVSSENIEEYSIRIILEIGNKKVEIANCVNVQADGDEYPEFIIKIGEPLEEATFHEIEDTIKEIRIVTDDVEWVSGETYWHVKADVALCFELFSGRRILIQLIDSLAGFMKYEILDDYKNEICNIESHWSMKADKLVKSKRVTKSVDFKK